MGRFMRRLLVYVLFALVTHWVISYAYCEILTFRHTREFTEVGVDEGVIGGGEREIKVLEYRNGLAEVLVRTSVDTRHTGSDLYALTFDSATAKWVEQYKDNIWSSGGANGFLWPYFR